MLHNKLNEAENACVERLRAIGAAEPVITNFLRLHQLVSSGTTGIINDNEIEPVGEIPNLVTLQYDKNVQESGLNALPQLVVCKLNGGLGTSMGLRQAKSLLHVREDPKLGRRISFNEINARQILALEGAEVPFINMVSFNTAKDVNEDLRRSELEPARLLFLQQNMHPKILADSLLPATHSDDSLCWNPPGHGDFFPAFFSSGLLQNLINQGKRYLFVSNADNLAASPDMTILGYFTSRNLPFLCEVTRRTPSDRKGGHLARRKSDSRLILREAAQAPSDAQGNHTGDFQDIARHFCFNINSIWIDLQALQKVVAAHGGILPLPLIRNKKTLDPRDPNSPSVYQLETAIGAAIELFDGAELLEVDRERFAPVKTTSDLLLVLSNCFELDRESTLRPLIAPLPQVSLCDRYRMIDDFEKLIKEVPRFESPESFSIAGNFKLEKQLAISGRVELRDDRSDKSHPIVLPEKYHKLTDASLVVSDSGILVSEIPW